MAIACLLLTVSTALTAGAQFDPPVTSVAYPPDGKVLAAGTRGEVVLIDPTSGEVRERIVPQTGRVTALAFNKAGDRLASASGEPGKSGEIRVYEISDRSAKLIATVVNAHKDIIYTLAFSPDGTLASAGYDRLIKLWEPTFKKEPRVLSDHSDTVNSLAFRADGKLLASAASDRAVKVWGVATGKRLYTLGEPTDWVYSVAWSPDGKRLAAAGVDKNIRIWEADESEGKLVHAVFAHTQPVTRIAYSKDGKSLFSISEGTNIKKWDAATMKEQLVFPPQNETMLSLALSPDQKQLAIGFFDGKLKFFNADTGKATSEPLPAAKKLMRQDSLFFTAGPEPAKEPAKKSSASTSPKVVAKGVCDSPRLAIPVQLPATISGAMEKAGNVDYFRIDYKPGQELAVQIVAKEGNWEPVLEIRDLEGNLLATSTNQVMAFQTGDKRPLALGIRDRDYRGEAGFKYEIRVGDFPLVTGVFPLSLERGKEGEIELLGVNLGDDRRVKMTIPADAAPGSKHDVPLPKLKEEIVGKPQVIAGEYPETTPFYGMREFTTGRASIEVPGTVNGRFIHQRWNDLIEFPAKKGQRLVIEVEAQRLGSPLDSVIEIIDDDGKPVMRNTLRCTARIIQTFRDVDSVQSGIRLESWNELAIDDHLYADGEVMRVRQLPKNPDDDCQFYQVAGQRQGFLDTTPTHHANGSALYKVEFHPPGARFPPNGLPVYEIPYRNDDGGAGFGKDSRLFFDPPADGKYRVRIKDARGHGGHEYAYRLTVRPPKPSFSVVFSPMSPSVWKGGSIPITATATRIDGFDGPIEVGIHKLAQGYEAPKTTIEMGQSSTVFPLFANGEDAKDLASLTFWGNALVRGDELTRLMYTPDLQTRVYAYDSQLVKSGPVKLLEPGDIVTTTNVQQVILKPGQQAKLVVTIERRNGFTGRIPVDVRGLPHGVRVLNIGLNGILITPGDTKREIVLYAEPWVKPMERPFIVLATREGKKTEHGARPVMLKVAE